jgi:antirestriction protein ArdC
MASVYQRVTDTLLEHLSNTSADAWVCPWHDIGRGLPTNLSSGRNYRGINILTLWSAAQRAGFGDNRWASYRQWSALGAQVRRGEKGSLVIFYQEGSSQGANRAALHRSNINCIQRGAGRRCARHKRGTSTRSDMVGFGV